MKSFVEMVREAIESEEELQSRLKQIKDNQTPSKTLVGFLHSKDQKIVQAAEEELRRRKEAGEDVSGFEDETSKSNETDQSVSDKTTTSTDEQLPINADSIARELDINVHASSEKDNKTKTIKTKPSEIILNPEYQARMGISEARERSIVFSFGRLNPITVGHEKLANKILNVASRKKADAALFISSVHDKKKNPLPYAKKLKYAKMAFPKVVRDLPTETKAFGMLIGIFKNLAKKYDHATMVVGSDRVDTMKNLLNKYNGKEYNFKTIEVISAGERDPDADDVSGMSASKMRSLATSGNFDSFKSGLPPRLRSLAKNIFDDIRSVMIKEETVSEAVLSVQQRLKRRSTIRRSRGKVRVGRRKAIRRKASGKVIDRRAKRLAVRFMRKRVLKGKKYADLSYSARAAVDRIVARRAVAIKRIAQRLSPKVRRAESQRKSGAGFKSVSLSPQRKVRKEDFEKYQGLYGDYMTEQNFLDFVHHAFDDLSEEFSLDLNISEQQYLSKKAEQSGESYDTLKKVFDRGVASWNMGLHEDVTPQQWGFARVNSFINEGVSRKTADVDLTEANVFGVSKSISPVLHMHSYKAAKQALQKTIDEKQKESSFSVEKSAEEIAKRFHGVNANKLVKLTQEPTRKDSYGNEIQVPEIGAAILKPMAFKDFISTDKNIKQTNETFEIDESTDSGLAAKADKSGISIGVLRKVYKRGVAAWNSGHRPGTTPQQWGMARVNSYITKGKGTYHGADKDLREEDFIEEMKKVPKDKESGLPKKYVSGLSSSTAKARAAHWSKMDKKSDRDPAAYEPAPGDASAKTKESIHTKKYREMYGEDMDEACWDGYKQVGLKKKGDKTVPNCVKEEAEEVSEARGSKYQLYHNTYSSAINHALAHHEKSGLSVHDDDRWNKVAIGSKKPSSGKTTSVNIPATHAKTGKKHMIHVQVYNKGGKTPYELNTYSSTHRSLQKEEYGAGFEGTTELVKKYKKETPGQNPNEESKLRNEATYQGKEVPLNKPMAGDVKKSKVYVDPDGDGKAQKVNFGDKNMTIKKDIPARRKSFRARHKCDTAKDKTTPRYWSCKAW